MPVWLVAHPALRDSTASTPPSSSSSSSSSGVVSSQRVSASQVQSPSTLSGASSSGAESRASPMKGVTGDSGLEKRRGGRDACRESPDEGIQDDVSTDV